MVTQIETYGTATRHHIIPYSYIVRSSVYASCECCFGFKMGQVRINQLLKSNIIGYTHEPRTTATANNTSFKV